MQTIKVDLKKLNEIEYEDAIKKAANIIKSGGIVAFPTETVYGLGANALDEDAVLKIFEAKGRPQDNPLIMHVCNFNIAPFVLDLNPMHIALFKEFWPGPLTILFKKSGIVPNRTTANLDTVGIRMPDNKVAQDLIYYSGVPIAAPSANISGRPSPTNYKRCVEDLDGKVDMILGYDQSEVGVESTIVDMTTKVPEILRPGAITLKDLENVLGMVHYEDIGQIKDGEQPKAPGMKYTHYSPKADVVILKGTIENKIKFINEKLNENKKENLKSNLNENNGNEKVRYILFSNEFENEINSESNNELKSQFNKIKENEDVLIINGVKEGLHEIFEVLRQSDDLGYTRIVIETVKEEGLGLTLMNRLKKSSGFNFIEC